MVLFGLLSSFAVTIIAPLLNAPNVQQAKIDTVQTGAIALYRLQRDVRQGQDNGVYVCTYPAPSTCSTPSAAPTLANVQVIAILTARANGSGFAQWSNTGSPSWTGFQVYWLASDGNGTYNLTYAFSQSTGFQPGASAASADTAVSAALQSTSPVVIAQHLLSIQMDHSAVSKMIGFVVAAQSTDGNKTNETSYEGDTFARN
jgi:hypothetical protein